LTWKEIQTFEFPPFFWLNNKLGPFILNVDPAHMSSSYGQKKNKKSFCPHKQNKRRPVLVRQTTRETFWATKLSLTPPFEISSSQMMQISEAA
jgi:hypothetical protein